MLVLFGPMTIVAPVILTLLISCVVILRAFLRNRLLEAFPSAAWALFMQWPFILISGTLSPSIAGVQALGICFVALALAIGDEVGLRSSPLQAAWAQKGIPFWVERLLIFGLGALLVFLPLYHIAQAGSLPIFEWLSSDFSNMQSAERREALIEISQQRETFGKLLEIPAIYKYAFNWTLSVFGPALIALLVFHKRWLVAIGLFSWLVAYAVLSTAKLPLLMLIIFTACACAAVMPNLLQRILRIAFSGACLAGLVLGGLGASEVVRTHNTVGSYSAQFLAYQARPAAQDPLREFSLTDAARLIEEENVVRRKALYLLYRTMLTPPEVSYYWYAYFSKVSGERRALSELVGQQSEGLAHASNRVGRWAYFERFPDKYLTSVSAYASIDADAYAFGGLWGVVIVALALILLRLLTSATGTSEIGQIVRGIMIAHLGMFPVSASLQAILVPQGCGILMFIAAVLAVVSRHRSGPTEMVSAR